MVVSIDYSKMEAIRAVQGVEERQGLTTGDSGFAVCKWLDGSTYQSAVANLMMDVKKAPLMVTRRKPAAAPKKKPAAAAPAEESGGEEEVDDMDEEDEQLEEVDAGQEAEQPAAKKAKIAKGEEDPTHTHQYINISLYIYIYIYIGIRLLLQCLRQVASASWVKYLYTSEAMATSVHGAMLLLFACFVCPCRITRVRSIDMSGTRELVQLGSNRSSVRRCRSGALVLSLG
jgi:hypothetical protein